MMLESSSRKMHTKSEERFHRVRWCWDVINDSLLRSVKRGGSYLECSRPTSYVKSSNNRRTKVPLFPPFALCKPTVRLLWNLLTYNICLSQSRSIKSGIFLWVHSRSLLSALLGCVRPLPCSTYSMPLNFVIPFSKA